MKKYFITLIAVIIASVIALCAGLVGCSGGEQNVWDVSAEGATVTASFADDGNYGFILKIEGTGAIKDFASAKDAPWYKKSGRVKKIEISDGVTAIGDRAFKKCAAKSVILPDSVKTVGEKAFSESTIICAYNSVTTKDGAIVYKYSENKPTTAGYFWRLKDGVATAWEGYSSPDKTTKVLFIGNSFTYYNDMPTLFGQIATAAGEKVVVDSVTNGAWNLTKFADVNDEYGKQVDDKLRATNDYDVVVLQEQSTRPLTSYDAFLAAAQSLKAKIDETQTACSIVLYATWGYPEEANNQKITIPEMGNNLREKYDSVATELGAKVSYVGDAFSTVYTNNPELNLYHTDNRHPSYAGSFLSACVHVATILNCDPTLSTFNGELDTATATLLKNVAYDTVFKK
ncbi:MAG: leucine-rich repeat protein [Candidatus Coproplasma sp.]